MKKVLTAFSLLISSSAMATGFYAGGQLGASSVTFNNIYSMYNSTPAPHYDKKNTSSAAKGIICGIYGGYRYDFNNFFVASELDYNANTASIESTHYYTKIKSVQNPSLAAHVLVGLPVGNNSEIYGRIGYTETVFKSEPKGLNEVPAASQKLEGIILGLGTQHHFTDQLSIRLDYKYTKYQEVTTVISTDTNSSSYKDKFSIKPESHALTIGAQYTF
ncbi:MAG: outer membrane beta-barrel protein [Candidatus Endonucleobacter sp. (ex Gigantidas childressi)]|nr:outer membrane beta-barrel protein [Candidatus Endonucleobacter sp. (ex Gigantidas childressi)]